MNYSEYPYYSSQGWVNPKQLANRFRFLEDSYQGSGGYATGAYLIPNKREKQADFEIRKMRSRIINHFKPIVDGMVTPIFRGSPTREFNGNINMAQAGAIDSFMADCDGSGTSFEDFMKKCARSARKYDSTFILIDNKAITGYLTEADLEERDNLPYLVNITPDRIIDIAMDEAGNVKSIHWITYETFEETGKIAVDVFWSDTIWRKEIKGEVIEQAENELGFVPVFPLYPCDNEDYTTDPMPYGLSFSLATIQYSLFNLASAINQIAEDQAYSILCFPGEAAELTLGSNNALVGYGKDGNEPKFISPDAGQLDTLYDKLFTGMVNEMYSTASMNHLRTFQQSADSKRLDNERTYEVLIDFREQIATLDKKLMYALGLYLGVELEYSVSYPHNFGIKNLEQDIEVYSALQGQAPSEVVSEIVKRIKNASLTGHSPEKMEALDLIIDNYYKLLNREPPAEEPVVVEDEEPTN